MESSSGISTNMPFVPLKSDSSATPQQGFTPIDTPLEYNTSPIVEHAVAVGKRIGTEGAQVADMVLGFPAFLAELGATGTADIYELAKGSGNQSAAKGSEDIQQAMQAPWMKFLANPVKTAMNLNTEGSTMDAFNKKISEWTQQASDYAVKQTGNSSMGPAVQQAVGIAMAKGGDIAAKVVAGPAALAGSSIASMMAKAKRTAGAPSGASATPDITPTSVADQLRAIRPEAPAVSPEAPIAAPTTPAGEGFTPAPEAQPAPVSPEPMPFTPEGKVNTEAPLPVPPPGAPTFTPKSGDVPTAPRHGIAGLPILEVPLKDLKLSVEVPQFKKEANAEGIVAPLGGKFDRVGVAPIQVWQRLNGDQEIISGRHRFDLAKRSGEETIGSQIHREADGFDAKQAATLDAILNIRDEQGGVNDYANYFRNSGITEEDANAKGLLARAKGKAGWAIGRDASDDVFAAHSAGVISDEAALAISRAAPKDPPAQAVGLKLINDGKSVSQAENTIRAIAMMQKNGEAKPEQGDIFGFDDSAIKQAVEMAKRASAAQRAIREQLAAVSGATKRPEIARKLGVDVKDPEAVKAKIVELHAAVNRLANWPLYPDLVREFRGDNEPLELKGETEAEIQAKESVKAKAADEERARDTATPPEDFVMSGSTRPADEAAARGQNDMFGNTPLKEEAKPAERRNAPERTAMYDMAKALAEREGKIGFGSLRRTYPQFDESKASRILSQLEEDGVIGPVDSSTGRHELLKGKPSEETAKAKPAEKKQPEEPATTVSPLATSLKQHVEALIKRKRFAEQIHLGRKLENAIDKAKAAMETGDGKPADFVKYAKWFRDKDPVTAKALTDIADTLKGGAKNVVKQEESPYGAAGHLATSLAKYEDTGEFMSVNDLVNDVDRLIGEDLAPDSLQEAIDDYHREQADDHELAGRGDMESADENFLAAVRAALPKNDVAIREKEAQYDLFNEEQTPKSVSERSGENPPGEQSAPDRLIRAAKAIPLHENEATPGLYYVSAKLEKVGERDLPAKITTSQDAANATQYLQRFAVEHFDAIVTDKAGKTLAVIGSFKGAAAQTSVYPATVMQELAKIKGGANLWASHNHPSGIAQLSAADRNLSSMFENLLRGSGVNYRGLMAVAGGKYSSTTFDNGEISTAPTQMVKAPIAERVTRGDPLHEMTVNTPSLAKSITPGIAKDKPGILFLSAHHAPVSFVPIDPADIYPLRENGRMMKLFNSAGSTGASAAIIANPDNAMAGHVTNNLAAALKALDINTLDVILYDSKNPTVDVKSAAETQPTFGLSSTIEQTHGEYAVHDSAQDMQIHNLLDQHKGDKSYSRDDALHDYMAGKRASSDYELFGGDKNSVHQIINFNIGLTPKDLAKGVGQIAKDAKAVVDRAKATKLGAAAFDWMDGVKEDLQTKVVPMAAGTDRARAIAKDFANADRLARWQWEKFDSTLKKNYTPEQREKMWSAAEDENQIRLEKLPEDQRKGRGLDRLTPEERATMDTLHQYGEDLLQRAKDVGLFKGTGVEYWSPRVVAMIGEDGTVTMPKAKGRQGFTPYSSPTGGNISVTASSLKARKYSTVAGTEAAAKLKFGEGAQVVKDIRTMPMAMARIERAIAGRELIEQIKEVGKQTGQDLVVEGQKEGFFTIDHPAFKTYRYRPDVVQKEAFDRLMMDQLNKFATDIGVDHERVAKMGGNMWGKAYMGGNKIESRFGGPESVITHEIGHQLDYKYGLAKKFVNDKSFKKELRALADLRYEGAEDQVSNHYKKYVREGSEKIANMVHAYVHAPDKFKAVAPNSYAEFTSFLKDHPELKGLNDIKPSLRLGTASISKRPPGEDFDVLPVYVSKEFEGPLKAIMTDKPGNLYQAMMSMKGKSMSVIMYSPLIHNGVEWGRALPLMPGKIITFKAYFDGNVAKNDPVVMRELINDGMVPIGHRFFMQDISGLMEDPTMESGRSWTAKIAGGAVGLVNKKAGESVKRGIDTAGDFWHNTLLWDRIGDLQAGIAVNIKADLIKKGMDPKTAGRVSSHLANRFAGALPNEAMSANARKVANFMFFSRTFSLGNLGVMKDMMTGLPKDVQAQILRDAGPIAAFAAKGAAQKAALRSVAIDISLMYGANAALQSGFDHMKRDKSWDDIEQGYVDRFHAMVHNLKDNPSDLLKPSSLLESLTPMSANEPGKEQRVLYDYDKTGTAIYVRLPTGKIGEEFLSWATSPLDILKRKEGTVMRPLIQTATNDRGFGRKVYDENMPGYKGAAKAVGNIAWNMLSQQFPTQSFNSAMDIARGKGDENDAMKTIGPMFGLTFSRGAPGGPEVGMMYTVEREHRAEISDAMPDIKRDIKNEDMEAAVARMYDAHMTPQEIRATIKFSQMPRARLTPQAMKKFFETSSPEEQQKMQNILDNRP